MTLRQVIHCARCHRLIADFSHGDPTATVLLTDACALCDASGKALKTKQ